MNQSDKFEYIKTISFRFLSLFFVIVFVECGLNSYGQGKVSRPTQQQSQSSKPKKSNPKVTVSKPDGYINGYGYVDLGLPRGTKWATCNIGAKSPEEAGDYFAWGETTTKPVYSYTANLYNPPIEKTDGSRSLSSYLKMFQKEGVCDEKGPSTTFI